MQGCKQYTVQFHPIKNTDIMMVNKGDTIGNSVAPDDGVYMSQYYLENVVKARLKDIS